MTTWVSRCAARRGATAHHGHLQTLGDHGVASGRQRARLVRRRGGHPVDGIAVPGEGEDAAHPQSGARAGDGDRPGLLRRAAGAVLAAVDLDDHLDAVRREQSADPGGTLDRLDADRDAAALGEVAQPLRHGLVHPDGVGDEEVVAAVPREDLGLTHRRHGQPHGPGAELEPGDLRRLVCLGVRAQ